MKISKKIVLVTLIFSFALSAALPVIADVPYRGYTYNHWRDMVPAPVAYIPVRSITARDISLTLGAFSLPQDMATDSNGLIYVMDTGNNRLVIFDPDSDYFRVIDGFLRDGQSDAFNSPRGVFVCHNNNIYIADTDNRRIVVLDSEGIFISQIYDPYFGDIDDEVDFRPLRVAVDRTGRVYVIVMHVFEGIMRFDTDGEFFGYFGSIRVRIGVIDAFWRMVSTQAQRARQRRFIPTEFSGVDVDEYGFVFATHSDVQGDQVMRLNPRGDNVLRNLNPNTDISGDQRYFRWGVAGGPSSFIDVVTRPYGMFSTLDINRGRVFTYDSEGNLLYVFGGDGSIMGMNRTPRAIEAIGDSILVLDAQSGRIVFYEPTEYGQLINTAIALRYQGDEAGSVSIWQQILNMDESNELAFTGIGRAHLLAGEYVLAMDYLRRGMDIRHFSAALQRRRQTVIEANLPFVLTGVLLFAFVMISRSIYRNVKGLNVKEEIL